MCQKTEKSYTIKPILDFYLFFSKFRLQPAECPPCVCLLEDHLVSGHANHRPQIIQVIKYIIIYIFFFSGQALCSKFVLFLRHANSRRKIIIR